MPCIVVYTASETFSNLKSLERAAEARGLSLQQVSKDRIRVGTMNGYRNEKGEWVVESTSQEALKRLKDEYVTAEVTKKAKLDGWSVKRVKDKKTNKIKLRLTQR